MPVKRIIVLANSVKNSARCVAGIEVGTGMQLVPAGWIRPVSGESKGELGSRHMRVAGALRVAPLDIMDVPLSEHAEDPIHPEDWIVDISRPWMRIGGLARAGLPGLEEKPYNLWLETIQHTDRATRAYLGRRSEHQSLYLIRPVDFRVEITYEHNQHTQKDQKKNRAKFRYGNVEYTMSITDPLFTDRYCRIWPELGAPALVVRPPYGDRCLLCVSLTPFFNGFHYKVVAAILDLP